jgi:hypothetical protein
MRYEHPYGHQMAVPSNYPRFSESESLCHRSLEYSRLRPNDAIEPDEVTSSMMWPDLKNNKIRCSMSKHVRKRRVAHMAPPPAVPMSCLPVILDSTCFQMRHNPTYGPQTAVSSLNPRFHQRTRCRVLEGLRRHHRDSALRSGPVRFCRLFWVNR